MYPKSFGDNPRFPSSADFKVVERVGSFGKGVVSYRAFRPGELIAEISGELTRVMTQHSLQIDEEWHLLDLYFSGYFLHSCDPNVTLDMKKRTVTAVRPIEKHDFLEMDYRETEHVLFKQFACCCGTTKCRGWITGSREEPNEALPEFQQYLQKTRSTV